MVGDAVEWIRDKAEDGRPWLLVGKGPTVERRGEFDFKDFHVLTLNHACRVVPATLAHFTDLEPAIRCIRELGAANTPIVLPWHPHVDFRPSPNNLGDYIRNDYSKAEGGLGYANNRHLLYSYNSTRARKRVSWLTVVPVRFFSAVAGLNLLALAGVRTVRSLGVDGGTAYAKDFDETDCLANGRTSFDAQFAEMHKTVTKYKLDYKSLCGAEA